MSEYPQISVIVPVYRVEQYLRRCLDSIINQTYRNLEIILVDDGSPDSCGAICDAYAQKDPRIKVIHQKNGGVSAARNAGLDMASGSWIGWVDSDDWIEPDMYEYLIFYALQAKADIAVCSRCEQYREKSVMRGWTEERRLNTEQALRLLLENNTMQNFLWDKLWRRELFERIRFPAGKTFEDIAVMHRLFEKAETVLCLPEAKYHYFQRPGSIVSDVSLSNRINYYRAAELRYYEMRDRWPQFQVLLESQCVASAVGIWCAYFKNPKEERQAAKSELHKIAEFGKCHARTAGNYMKLGITGRIAMRLIPYPYVWAFAGAMFLGEIYKIKHRRIL